MLLDAQVLLSDNQDLSQAAGAYVSTGAIDLGVPGTMALGGSPISDIGRGNVPSLLCQVTETFTSGGAATLTVEVISASASTLDAGVVSHMSSGAIALATLIAGYQFRLAIPHGITGRYLGLRYTIGTAATTAGTVTAGLVMDLQTNPTV